MQGAPAEQRIYSPSEQSLLWNRKSPPRTKGHQPALLRAADEHRCLLAAFRLPWSFEKQLRTRVLRLTHVWQLRIRANKSAFLARPRPKAARGTAPGPVVAGSLKSLFVVSNQPRAPHQTLWGRALAATIVGIVNYARGCHQRRQIRLHVEAWQVLPVAHGSFPPAPFSQVWGAQARMPGRQG